MRFVPSGPEIPNDLIAEQQRGNVLFVCGAGVSMAAGLPSFMSLVKGVYHRLGEDWEPHPAEREVMVDGGRLAGQYDRALRILERRLAASDVRKSRGMRGRLRLAVEQELAPKPSSNLSHHLALLELSKDGEGGTRLLTTNFDTLFERSWFDAYKTQLPSHAGPAMPRQGTGGFEGVLHLHGRIEDHDLKLDGTDLVLTSAEFGDAYLRSGWATRYVYDLARACTLVLFGYSADDPPMRYLLEVLEDDRARYPDLKPVYAFAPARDGSEVLERELWRAKGIEPVLYRSSADDDHASLYATLEAWRHYVADPTGWRERRLRDILAEEPAIADACTIKEAVDLLAHGDAETLFHRLAPGAGWWPVFAADPSLRARSGALEAWLSARVADPEMVRACVTLQPSDPSTFHAVLRQLPRVTATLTPPLSKAWRLLAHAAQERASDEPGMAWLLIHRINSGDIDQSVRDGVSEVFRPRLSVQAPFLHAQSESIDPSGQLDRLLRVEFEPRNHPTVQEILVIWPTSEAEALFRQADRVLAQALDEAADAGYLSGLDRASYGVKWVGAKSSGHFDTGFAPIVRLITALWAQIAVGNPERAVALASRWNGGAHLLLVRLYLHALADREVYPDSDVPMPALAGLDDRTFWVSDATREIEHLLVARWPDFSESDRGALEERMRSGPPRHLARQEELIADDVWQMVWDQLVFQHLEPLMRARLPLSGTSEQLLVEIAGRYPDGALASPTNNAPLPGSAFLGPRGDPAVFAAQPDADVVREALRIQQADWLGHGDVWRLFCRNDPQRALRAILSAEGDDRWRPEIISPLLDVARETDDAGLQAGIGDLFAKMRTDQLAGVAAPATWWLWERAKRSAQADNTEVLSAWDNLARAVYASDDGEPAPSAELTIDAAIASAGGILAIALVVLMSKRTWQADEGFDEPFLSRLDIVVTSETRAGLQGRMILVRDLAFLEHTDPAWVTRHLVPRLCWNHAEAASLWRARAGCPVGRPGLFTALNDDFLEAVRRAGSGENIGGLAYNFVQIARWAHDHRADTPAPSLSKMRSALAAASPEMRERTARVLWRRMAGEKDEAFDRAERWRSEVGPVFDLIWPLDAGVREPDTSRTLAMMALECSDAFPDAVEAIHDLVVAYDVVTIGGWLQAEPAHREATAGHPRAFLRLLDAVLSSERETIPADLGAVLDDCLAAAPSLRSDPSFVRLDALRRRQAA